MHGLARSGKATVFPQSIGLGATFDPDLVYRMATAISDEARAFYIKASKRNNRGLYTGLTFYSPNVNIYRDPRWGRGQETYGEDPYLTSLLGVAFVKGLQGNDDKYLKAAACAKHFAVHSGPEEYRHSLDAIVGVRDLYETYLPAFKAFRITSYNVCYTKLLRVILKFSFIKEVSNMSFISQRDARITSYNVCYTKLLRLYYIQPT